MVAEGIETKRRSLRTLPSYFLTSYQGFIGLTILFELAIIVFLSTFSQPVVEIFGQPIIPINLDTSPRSRVARIVMLYHALAVPFITAVAFFVMKDYEIRPKIELHAKWTLLVGAFVTGIFGLNFAYGLTDWTSHGLFLVGLSLSFYGGVLLLMGIFPTKSFPVEDNARGAELRGINLEYFNMWLSILAILISTVIGGIAGAHFGNGFQATLAEDIVRNPHHNIFERMVVSHLHIMVALLAAAAMLLMFKYSGMSGRLFRWCMILFIPGVVIMSIGAWLVVPDVPNAHMIINVGAMFLLLDGTILAVYGMIKTSQRMLGKDYTSASFGEKFKGLLKDPVDFGMYFQLLWVNVVVTIPGIYVAINLDTFRSPEYLEVERSFNTGHWHVLATLIAIIMVYMSINMFEIKGQARSIMGWVLTLGTIIGFGFAVPYMLRDPDTSKTTLFVLIDLGVMLMFLAIAIFGVYYLINIVFQEEIKQGEKDHGN